MVIQFKIVGDSERATRVAAMLAKGFVPSVPYTNSKAKWAGVCLKCGQPGSPTYNSVQRGQGACRYCAKSTVDSAIAVGKMLARDFQPNVPYESTKNPWPGVCLKCGEPGSPTLGNSRQYGSCLYCSRSRLLPEITFGLMLANDFLPSVPYRDSKAPWNGVCLKCGQPSSPSYNSVQGGQGACVYCAGKATDRAVLVGRMLAADWQPLTPYTGSHSDWRCRCLRCGEVGEPSYHSVWGGTRGCSTCAEGSQLSPRRTSTGPRTPGEPREPRRRITPQHAVTIMKECGWIPQEGFPGPRDRWRCKCQQHGHTGYPVYETVHAKKSGCKLCAAVDNGRRRRERLAPKAIVVMRTRGLEPQVPYPGASSRWLCECQRCGELTTPTYSNVKRGGLGCETCRRRKQSGTRRASAAPQRVRQLREFGYEPLEDFPTTAEPWRVRHQICGEETTVRLSNLLSGSGGCRTCAPTGFNGREPAYLYLLEHSELDSLKVGVTQVGTTRLSNFTALGWSVLLKALLPTGQIALSIETAILKRWRNELNLPPYLTREVMPIGGSTETVEAAALNVQLEVRTLQYEIELAKSGMAMLSPKPAGA